MDGVIIDSEPLHQKVEKELIEELGGEMTAADQEHFVGTTDEYMWSTFKERFNLKSSVEEMIINKKNRFMEEIQKISLVEGFKEVLEVFADEGYPIALASSNNRRAVDQIVKQFGLDEYLEFAMSGEDVRNGKPDPEIFLKTAEAMSVDPKDCLVIEDAKNGVLAAKAAGMKCIGFNHPNSGTQDLSEADLIIDSYDEFDLEEVKNLFN